MSMAKKISFRRAVAAYTLAEVMITVGVMSLTGAAIFSGLNASMIMFAKNTAINISHQEGRNAINRLVRDIHASVSVPQLIDVSFNSVDNQPVDSSGQPTGTCGVAFQMMVPGSPNYVKNDVPNNMIMIQDNGSPPTEGQRLIAPMWNVEQDIYKVSVASSNGHHNVWLQDGSEVTIRDSLPNSGVYSIVYYTDRVAYLVINGRYVADANGQYVLNGGQYVLAQAGASGQHYRYEGGELHFYKRRMQGGSYYYQDIATVARNITSPTPFSVPLNASGTPDNRYVGVRLTASDPAATTRGYRSTSTLLNTSIPYRSRICVYQ